MTETEKRRIELLKHTRQLYADQEVMPAIHPRYQSIYQSLYGRESATKSKSTFGIRTVIAIVLFGVFLLANKSEWNVADTVVNEIVQDVLPNILEKGD